MFSLVYVSSALLRLSKADLLALLIPAQLKNKRLGITGMLLYKDGNFMQALEGEEHTVRALLETIKQDERHHRLIVLIESQVPQREFADWSMGFCNLDDDTALRSIEGYSEFMNVPLVSNRFTNAGDARRLLAVFHRMHDGPIK